MTMKAKLHPCWTPELGAQGFPYSDRYNVTLDGELLVKRSRDPECDAARVLVAKGITGKLTMLDGNTGKPRTIVNIEKAAQWCVGSNLDKYRWKGGKGVNYSPPIGETGLVVPTIPPSASEAA
jgi:hypothetical protein